jgi:hypothetical protein
VLTKVHRYDPIGHVDAPIRNSRLGTEVFEAKLASSSLDMRGVKGHSPSTEWWSPSAPNASKPYVELELFQFAREHDEWHLLMNAWLCTLMKGGTMLVREIESEEWFFCLAVAADSCVVGWRAELLPFPLQPNELHPSP